MTEDKNIEALSERIARLNKIFDKEKQHENPTNEETRKFVLRILDDIKSN